MTLRRRRTGGPGDGPARSLVVHASMNAPPMPATTDTAGRLHVESLFDEATSTFSHLVLDRATMQCAVVDSVLDYDPASGRTSTASADRLIARVRELGARVQWLLETHVHADTCRPRRSCSARSAAGSRSAAT